MEMSKRNIRKIGETEMSEFLLISFIIGFWSIILILSSYWLGKRIANECTHEHIQQLEISYADRYVKLICTKCDKVWYEDI
jgi:uncharacterized membrane protein YciS (DUF1049 family)